MEAFVPMNPTNGIETILEQAQAFFIQHAPVQALTSAVPFAIVCLVAGIGLSVLGAKLSRFGTACASALVGGAAGNYFAQQTGYPTLLCGLVGAVMVGIIGYQTFRLWVGLGVAFVVSTIALGAFGYQRVLPRVAEYEKIAPYAAAHAGGADTFALPSPEQQGAYRMPDPAAWARDCWGYVTQQDAQAEPKAKAIALAAMVTGLCLGVLALRTALIVATSLVGTALVTTSIATVLTQSGSGSYQAFQNNPKWIGIGVGGFFVTSLLVQTLLTRKAPGNKDDLAKA